MPIMENIGVVGASFRNEGAELLAQLTVPKSDRTDRLPELARQVGVRELVYIATCNRVEVAFKGDGKVGMQEYRRRVFRALVDREPRAGEAERSLRAWVGEGAVEHLFLVAAGLDSAQLGEHEIRTQVRDALKMAREAGVSGTLLDYLLTEALRVALRIHQQTPTSGSRVSLADIVVKYLLDRLNRTPGQVALIGVSPMTRRCGLLLADKGQSALVVNRTPEVAVDLALELGGEHRSLDEFRARPDAVEALLSSWPCTRWRGLDAARSAPSVELPETLLGRNASLPSSISSFNNSRGSLCSGSGVIRILLALVLSFWRNPAPDPAHLPQITERTVHPFALRIHQQTPTSGSLGRHRRKVSPRPAEPNAWTGCSDRCLSHDSTLRLASGRQGPVRAGGQPDS